MKKISMTLMVMLLSHPGSAMEVFNRHIVSKIKMNDMTRKLVDACLLEINIEVCKFAGSTKETVNKVATFIENEAKDVAYSAAGYIGVKKPVAIVIYATKVYIDKKVQINALKKIPLLNNDSGTLELSDRNIKWTIGWNF